jgi:hypothetical protein
MHVFPCSFECFEVLMIRMKFTSSKQLHWWVQIGICKTANNQTGGYFKLNNALILPKNMY